MGTGKLKVQGTDDGNRSGHRRGSRAIFTILIWYCMSWLTEEKREGFSRPGAITPVLASDNTMLFSWSGLITFGILGLVGRRFGKNFTVKKKNVLGLEDTKFRANSLESERYVVMKA